VHECLELTGDISDGELASWYRRADVFVCGSLHEGFCVPLVEAMAFGVPIVSTAAGACAETIGDAGLVFEERDPWVLAEAIYHLWAHPTDRTLLQQQGCARYEALYSQECLEKQLSALMAKLA
jgi:glycosyltransferase involved in cell wall biosynthesis